MLACSFQQSSGHIAYLNNIGVNYMLCVITHFYHLKYLLKESMSLNSILQIYACY